MRGLMQVFLLWHRKNDWFQIIQKYFLQFFIFIKFIYHIKTSATALILITYYTLIRHLKLGSLTIWFMLPIIVMGLMWNNLFFAELDVLRWFFIDTWEVFIKEPMPLTARSQTRHATIGFIQSWRSIFSSKNKTSQIFWVKILAVKNFKSRNNEVRELFNIKFKFSKKATEI